MPRIVFVGNFSVDYSTESHHAWTWEKLGWEVVKFQENSPKTSTDAIVEACRNANLFSWTSTHGWRFGGSFSQDEMVARIRELKVPSFSYHLDVYWGLSKLDGRENRIGQHPSWKLDRFYSTDGSHQKEFESRGVHHVFLPPAVVSKGIYRGDYSLALAHDIGFVGSTGYHPEHFYRRQLIENLKSHYGNRFRTYCGMREQALNNTYASIKCVIGDHCFSTNRDYLYYSDRLPETCGRYGFMIYPFTRGLEEWIKNGLITYNAGDFGELFRLTDYWLDPTHSKEKEDRRNSLAEYVKNHHTYSHRLQFILDDIFHGS